MLQLNHQAPIVKYRFHRQSGIDKQIQITVNQGSFPDNSSAYLYVVDAGGNVSPGKQIKFGSSDDGNVAISVPPTPNLSITNVTP